jgi:Ca2+-transporting ATPase
MGEEEARTLAMIAITAGNLALVASLARRRGTWAGSGGRAYLLIALGASTVLAACILQPALRDLFHFALPAPADALKVALLGAASGLVLELLKPLAKVQRVLGNQARNR